MGLGFEVAESMSGSWYRLDDPLVDRAISFSIRIGVNGIRRFLRDRAMTTEGTIVAVGLADESTPVRGSVSMKLFDEGRVPYDVSFTGDDGEIYRLRGQRDFFVHDARRSLAILTASLYGSTGVEIGRAVLRGGARNELPLLLKSFRPRVRRLTK